MALSPRFTFVSGNDPAYARESPMCVYSFDLDGNVLEMNQAMAEVLGYNRQETCHMNLAQLLDPDSWKESRDHTLVQLGGAGPQWLNLTALARDGRRVPLAMVRRLLFERGRPVAVQDSGRVLGTEKEPLPGDANRREGHASGRFAEQLKQLHRLSTTSYLTLEQALDDH